LNPGANWCIKENWMSMETTESAAILRQRHEQMLKLVAKGFFNELINYGVGKNEILTVAGHLLDNIMQNNGEVQKGADFYNRLFTRADIQDQWAAAQRLKVHQVSLGPFEPALAPWVRSWLAAPRIRDSFQRPFPEVEADLITYFEQPQRRYFVIYFEEEPVGLIGAEHIDPSSSMLEMRKLVGDPSHQGKGIGKRATFLFLYYVFVILGFHKVYLHSMDINVRNLNLNSQFGFELEGVFFEDALIRQQRYDVIRMGLRAPVWLKLFA
jgi:RimJ/RimL family protein N-acetyltransferase